MTEPVVYVSTWKIKEGKFDAYARFHERLANTVRDLEPRVAAFLAFANDDGSEVAGIHVFSDGDGFDRQGIEGSNPSSPAIPTRAPR